jgi:hypothetical protein
MRRALSVLVLLASAVVSGVQAQRFPPDSFTNLRVLPKDIASRKLVNLMAGFTRALGVRCSHCHVGEEGRPLETYDFAKDDKILKRKAREMLRMVQAINEQHLTKVEERVEPRIVVTCATCHRGVREPVPLQDLVLAAYRAAGIDSALAAYRGLRDRYYGRAAYDFGDVALTDVATAVVGMNRLGDAERLLQLNLEHHCGSVFAQRQHAGVALRRAFVEGSVARGTALYRDLKARYQRDAFAAPMLNQIRVSLARGEAGGRGGGGVQAQRRGVFAVGERVRQLGGGVCGGGGSRAGD